MKKHHEEHYIASVVVWAREQELMARLDNLEGCEDNPIYASEIRTSGKSLPPYISFKRRRNMEIDRWVGGYKVRAFPWVDGSSIYFSVSYYVPGQSLSKPPVWEKLAYITDNKAGRRAVYEFTHSVTNYIAGMKIPQGDHAVLTF